MDKYLTGTDLVILAMILVFGNLWCMVWENKDSNLIKKLEDRGYTVTRTQTDTTVYKNTESQQKEQKETEKITKQDYVIPNNDTRIHALLEAAKTETDVLKREDLYRAAEDLITGTEYEE